MSSLACTDTTVGSEIWRYELDELEPDARDRFERHLMVCEACRREVSEMLPALGVLRERRAELVARLRSEEITYDTLRGEIIGSFGTNVDQDIAVASQWSRTVQWLSQWRRSWILAPAIGVAALAAVLLFTWSPPRNDYVSLLEFEPLLYERHGARAAEVPRPTDPFSVGMDAYCSGEYKRAADYLSQAVASESNSDTAWLYLGISRFLDHNAEPAIEALRQVRSSGNRSLRDAAQWYLAQAFLLSNQADSALHVLEQVDRESRWSPRADVLATKLWRLSGKR